MTIEGTASIVLGWASKSLLLEAFGIDCGVEMLSAVLLLWRLKLKPMAELTKRELRQLSEPYPADTGAATDPSD